MIDIHSHILPGLDDGACSVDEALLMAKAAVKDGITDIVATPHSSFGVGTVDLVQEQIDSLQKVLDSEGVALHLAAGLEVWLSADTVEQFLAGRVFTINSGNYMLVEFPPVYVSEHIIRVLRALQLEGVTPVVAHPERYATSNFAFLYELVYEGNLLQVDAGSLLGFNGHKAKQTADVMLLHNLAHVIASDAHSAIHRLPLLSPALKRAVELVGEERAKALVITVPQAILEGRGLDLPEALPYHNRWNWLSRLRR